MFIAALEKFNFLLDNYLEYDIIILNKGVDEEGAV